MSIARSNKKAVNVSISAELLQAARDKGINLSAALEAAVERELKQFRRTEWLELNSDAIKAYNCDIKEHGAFSEGLRSF
jgi:antitoxin CcdA